MGTAAVEATHIRSEDEVGGLGPAKSTMDQRPKFLSGVAPPNAAACTDSTELAAILAAQASFKTSFP